MNEIRIPGGRKIFWGDIHNHCGITYGFGSLENALHAARGHLDFCSVTGHAMWPDMPAAEGPEFAFIERFHREGFAKLAARWDYVRKTLAEADRPGEFVTFQGYEIHSRLKGDYHILSPDDGLPLVEAPTPAALVEALRPREAIAIPHHVGYTPGYRGCDWEAFREGISPVVEIFSKHGCGLAADSPFPYLHTMGPRDSRTVAAAGLGKGHRFGFAASTDHHAGYPGSWGDGRLAVLAAGRTRRDIWEAILARRTYAVTGDRMECLFSVNGALAGEVAAGGGAREINLSVKACDRIERVTFFKNGIPWKIIAPLPRPVGEIRGRCKIRLEMGWGRNEQGFPWRGVFSLSGGRIISVEPCFRGRSVLAPGPGMKDDPEINRVENAVVEQGEDVVAWVCTSFKNTTTLHAQTAALVFEVEADGATAVKVEINGLEKEIPLSELARGPLSFHLKAYNSEAFVLHAPVPERFYRADFRAADPEAAAGDFYYAEVRQANGQFAWLSPVWMEE